MLEWECTKVNNLYNIIDLILQRIHVMCLNQIYYLKINLICLLLGSVVITNLPASKFYINEGLQEVFNMRHWYECAENIFSNSYIKFGSNTFHIYYIFFRLEVNGYEGPNNDGQN